MIKAEVVLGSGPGVRAMVVIQDKEITRRVGPMSETAARSLRDEILNAQAAAYGECAGLADEAYAKGLAEGQEAGRIEGAREWQQERRRAAAKVKRWVISELDFLFEDPDPEVDDPSS